MRILILGDFSTAMFLLSTEPCYIINLVPPESSAYTDCKKISEFIDLCISKNFNRTITNETPWSFIRRYEKKNDLYKVYEKIYGLAGWKPDIIICVYPSDYSIKKSDKILLEQAEIPVFSLNTSDPNLRRNLITLIEGSSECHMTDKIKEDSYQ